MGPNQARLAGRNVTIVTITVIAHCTTDRHTDQLRDLMLLVASVYGFVKFRLRIY